MLTRLQGRTHKVYTGVACLGLPNGKTIVEHRVTSVTMRAMTEEEIAAYIATGEPADKAGSYAIQGLGSILVERIEGCYFNVVGLPLSLLGEMLSEFGITVLSEREAWGKRDRDGVATNYAAGPPHEERPRERMMHYGAESLSQAELLAILLRTGTRRESAIHIAQQMLGKIGGLRGLVDLSIEELTKINGIGPAKAVQLKAGIELGRRLANSRFNILSHYPLSWGRC